ncbi:hypothetical protein M514_28086 [Trichuris suis]|uniref:Uncharacterized protein n=1 Tax=Trichuris suis TaxID=68888 RepID=A0A085MR88_9BILA|nr:hypothetical protein M514_28086 [Trichuris suis]
MGPVLAVKAEGEEAVNIGHVCICFPILNVSTIGMGFTTLSRSSRYHLPGHSTTGMGFATLSRLS